MSNELRVPNVNYKYAIKKNVAGQQMIYLRINVGSSGADVLLPQNLSLEEAAISKCRKKLENPRLKSLSRKQRENREKKDELVKSANARRKRQIKRLKVAVDEAAEKDRLHEIDRQWIRRNLEPKKKIKARRLTGPDGIIPAYMNRTTNPHAASTVKKIRTVMRRVEDFEGKSEEADQRNQARERRNAARLKRSKNGDTPPALEIIRTGKKRYYFTDQLNYDFRKDFHEWLKECKYDPVTIGQTFKVLRDACSFASLDPYTKLYKDWQLLSTPHDAKHFTTKRDKIPPVVLTMDELQAIQDLHLSDQEEDTARDWLIIQAFSGQRVGDLFTMNASMVDDGKIHLVQAKGGKPVAIPIMQPVKKILAKYKGQFPPMLRKSKSATEIRYNELLKVVCRKAKINTPVKVKDRIEDRRRSGNTGVSYKTVPKHKAIASHSLRRSFATNFYKALPLSAVRAVTGHSSDRMLLNYINLSESDKEKTDADLWNGALNSLT